MPWDSRGVYSDAAWGADEGEDVYKYVFLFQRISLRGFGVVVSKGTVLVSVTIK